MKHEHAPVINDIQTGDSGRCVISLTNGAEVSVLGDLVTVSAPIPTRMVTTGVEHLAGSDRIYLHMKKAGK